jgi:glycosyltransferase involved in cell wall biosynthesis
LAKIAANPGIQSLGRINRDELIQRVLPATDVYLLPTYAETFGMSVLEAMAAGIPVVATDIFAIPEMLEHGVSGLLIETSRWDCGSLFRGYVVNQIPADFRAHMTETLTHHLRQLVESPELRHRLGMNALAVARSKFSFETRNAKMLRIYQDAI